MTARAAAFGLTLPPSPDDTDTAYTEGWIALPTTTLANAATLNLNPQRQKSALRYGVSQGLIC